MDQWILKAIFLSITGVYYWTKAILCLIQGHCKWTVLVNSFHLSLQGVRVRILTSQVGSRNADINIENPLTSYFRENKPSGPHNRAADPEGRGLADKASMAADVSAFRDTPISLATCVSADYWPRNFLCNHRINWVRNETEWCVWEWEEHAGSN